MIDATPLLRLWARRRLRHLSAMDPAAVQQAELLKLVRAAAQTRFGRAHGFARIRTVADFQAAVPVRNYDAFRDDIWGSAFPQIADVGWPGPVGWFALTSGTTRDVTKYIPVTKAMIRSNKRAALDIVAHHLAARPGSRVGGGLSFVLGGSTDLKPLAPGIRAGDISGIAAATAPVWVRLRTWPPTKLALEPDWERKIGLLARGSAGRDVRSIAGTPSWLLLLFERLAELRPDAARDLTRLWPNLELVDPRRRPLRSLQAAVRPLAARPAGRLSRGLCRQRRLRRQQRPRVRRGAKGSISTPACSTSSSRWRNCRPTGRPAIGSGPSRPA